MNNLRVSVIQKNVLRWKNISGYSFAPIIILALTTGVFADDEALSKKLVRKWEGIVAVKTAEHRTLVITSINRDGSDLVAKGTFGREKGLPVKIKTIESGSDITLMFDAANGNDVNLKLVSDQEMEGTFTYPYGRKQNNAMARFKKVE
jgi:hypothetical protein